MSITFRNYFLSDYAGIDYERSSPERGAEPEEGFQNGDSPRADNDLDASRVPIEQGYFQCSKNANKGRLISLIDIVSQVAKLLFDTSLLLITIPILAGAFAVGFTVSVVTFLIPGTEGRWSAKAKHFSYGCLAFSLVSAVSILVLASARLFTISTNVAGVACPSIGQWGRLKTHEFNLLELIQKIRNRVE